MDRISIVVCTFNRSDVLQGCLESLENQTLDPACFEVLIVDNNSTDATKQVGERFVKQNSNFHYCFEANQGLSHARNRGWAEATGDWIGYIDDDAKASRVWLETARKIIVNQRPDIFGGPYYAFYDSAKPQWFADRYASSEKGPTPRNLNGNEFLSGTNIFFRRELLSSIGGFDPNLGMSGAQIGYGEETALMITARKRFPDLEIFYDPSLYVFHLVPPHKMTFAWLARQRFVAGRWSARVFGARSRTFWTRVLSSGIKVALLSLYFGVDLVRSLWRDGAVYPTPQNYVYEHSLPILMRIGSAWEKLTNCIRGN